MLSSCALHTLKKLTANELLEKKSVSLLDIVSLTKHWCKHLKACTFYHEEQSTTIWLQDTIVNITKKSDQNLI